jgi:hypothetical protein
LPDAGLDRANQLVLGHVARLPVAHAHEAADPGGSIGCGNHDLRCCKLSFEVRNPPLESYVFLKQLVQRRVVREATILARLAQSLAHVCAAVRAQSLELGAKLLVASAVTSSAWSPPRSAGRSFTSDSSL